MRHVVFGCNGTVGLELMEQLAAAGEPVRGVCRRGRAAAPEEVEIVAGDATDSGAVCSLSEGADVIHCTIGLQYDITVWERDWPRIVENLVLAASRTGARLVFADNLYCYGPQSAPLREDLPLADAPRKPALRARLARRLFEAHQRGEATVTMVRASDFFGPRATENAMLGSRVFAAALAGKRAMVIGNVDLPHDYTYVPDFARALVRVSREPDAFGRAWHVPNPATRTTRSLIEEIYALAGQKARIAALPLPLLRMAGWFSPLMREIAEMGFQWSRPYRVDANDFAARFDFAPTPWEIALPHTLEWFRANS